MVVDTGTGPAIMTAHELVSIWEQNAVGITAVSHEVRQDGSGACLSCHVGGSVVGWVLGVAGDV